MSKSKRVFEWINKNIIVVAIAVLLVSVSGNVFASVYNADSVNNLSEAVTEIRDVNEAISSGQERTSCRTSVQAEYDATFSYLLMASIVADPDLSVEIKAELAAEYQLTSAVIEDFEDSVVELSLLSAGKICVGDDPVRAPHQEK